MTDTKKPAPQKVESEDTSKEESVSPRVKVKASKKSPPKEVIPESEDLIKGGTVLTRDQIEKLKTSKNTKAKKQAIFAEFINRIRGTR